jgi:hypothetical protein
MDENSERESLRRTPGRELAQEDAPEESLAPSAKWI